MIEAKCNDCNETFIPEDENDLIHGVRNDGEPCGGQGVIVGEWKLSTTRLLVPEPTELVLATLDTGSFSFEALAESREHADYMMESAWRAHQLDYPEAQGWEVWKDDVNYSDIKIGDVLRDGETLVATGPAR